MSGVVVSEWLDFTQEYVSWVYVVADACVLWLHVFKGFQSSKCVRRKSLPGRVHTHTYIQLDLVVSNSTENVIS